MAEAKELTFSVVIISWNQVDFLRRLVGLLLAQEYESARYEIIVADDGSSDGSREWLASQTDSRLKPLLGDQNRGRSAARNRGILAASGRYIVMIDGDHTVQADLLSVLEARHRTERCVIVGKSDFVDHPHFRAINHYLNHSGATKLPRNARLPGRYFLTRICSVPRDLLLEVGLFDERFVFWGGEDLDLGVRLEKSGIPIYGEPDARAVHHHLRPVPELLSQLYVYGRDAIPVLLEKHPQLYRELNLHRIVPEPGHSNAALTSGMRLMRLVMTAAPYAIVRAIARTFRSRILPRAIFDYLHFRQYSRGYRDSLRNA